ncbi:Integrase catalytic region [Anaeromyxobacter sp. K]|uniref:IS21-like element ISAnsp5 family transposase n=1 Tax=Anaeromyxobacter sp. (strain K) TaxID=447217 RepID=UPI00015F8D67|nr:IS21-like element ISAnsp5 family transposase [Anaeromyxobacter sp. K]ACG72558.1 Integrase catalytic region [Anaeromyxobacter sp. K]
MGSEMAFMAPPTTEVPMVEAEAVRQMRDLAAKGWGAKRIARELGVARNTVRRYLRGAVAELQRHPSQQRLDEVRRAEAVALFDGEAEGNAVVVAQMLGERGIEASVRTVQRAVADRRREQRAADVATVRFETAPGRQMQIDFGERQVWIAGERVTVHFMAAVLSYSRRIFVKAFLHERQGEWLDGIASAFQHFGGVPLEVLGDNTRCLVAGRNREAQTVIFHPAYVAFCRDWDVQPRACQPYRARTKGKTESGVKYVKRNAIAGRRFDSFAHLQDHLSAWQLLVDGRVHGTTHEVPAKRFDRDEREALRSLPARPLPTHGRRLQRRVANDSLIDIDTVRYSVPHRLVRDRVEALVTADEVRVFHGRDVVAVHARSFEPHARVIDPAHLDGLWRRPAVENVVPIAQPLAALGRTLDDYAAVIGGAA